MLHRDFFIGRDDKFPYPSFRLCRLSASENSPASRKSAFTLRFVGRPALHLADGTRRWYTLQGRKADLLNKIRDVKGRQASPFLGTIPASSVPLARFRACPTASAVGQPATHWLGEAVTCPLGCTRRMTGCVSTRLDWVDDRGNSKRGVDQPERHVVLRSIGSDVPPHGRAALIP